MDNKYLLMINLEENVKNMYIKTLKEEGYEFIEKGKVTIAKKTDKTSPREEEITEKMIFRYSMSYAEINRAYIDISKEANDSIEYLKQHGIESIKFHNTPGYFIRNAITRGVLNKEEN